MKLKICIFAEDSLKTLNEFNECVHEEFVDFINENLEEIENFDDLKELISDVKVKSRSKISKFKIQIYAFFYKEIMKFPNTFF